MCVCHPLFLRVLVSRPAGGQSHIAVDCPTKRAAIVADITGKDAFQTYLHSTFDQAVLLSVCFMVVAHDTFPSNRFPSVVLQLLTCESFSNHRFNTSSAVADSATVRLPHSFPRGVDVIVIANPLSKCVKPLESQGFLRICVFLKRCACFLEQGAQAHRGYLCQRSCSMMGEAETDHLCVTAGNCGVWYATMLSSRCQAG